MSKVEEKAMEKYPPHSVLIVPARRGGYYADSHMREGFIEGYLKAEKDLELTWEDIKEIYFLFKAVLNEWYGHGFSDEGICREVLKRFKERKGEVI